ncbi:MAG: flagellar hook-associated protein FlgK [Candidatus Eiseniibacteriota bacterium]
MSLINLLAIARSALLAQQRAMEVTGHNVSNASTPGYSRQRLLLETATPLTTVNGSLGRGVSEQGVIRVRDSFLDAAYRRSAGLFGQSGTSFDVLSQIQSVLHEPSSTGLVNALDGMFHAFSDLANDPSSANSRTLLREAAVQLVNQLHDIHGQLSQLGQDAFGRMSDQVGQVNQLTSQIAELNAQIVATGGVNGQAPDLQDRRDQLIDQLSGLVGVQVVDRPDGTVGVIAGTTSLVDGASSTALAVQPVGGGFGVGLASGGGLIDPRSGSLKSLVDLSTQSFPALQAGLDQFTSALVNEVNNVHVAGFTLSGATNINFFDPAGVTAGNIALSSDILASTDNIAAAATNAPGDGGQALKMAQCDTVGLVALGGQTMRGFYTSIATSLGVQVQSASQDQDTHQTMMDQADAQRQSVSGVSIDDEMVTLIGQQQAYSAAARLVTVADQMMQELITMMGTA